MVDPALFYPVMDLRGDYPQFASNVWDPPFISSQQVLTKEFSGKAQSSHQIPDTTFGKSAASARRRESFAVERFGDLKVIEASGMQFADSFR